jgi:TRAP-type mannitol/chloroaromatic compound transport system permease small subunit
MIEKLIKNKWFLLFTFLIVVAFSWEAATLSYELMKKSSTFAFYLGVKMLIITTFIFVFWTYIIINQLVVLLKEKKINKKI